MGAGWAAGSSTQAGRQGAQRSQQCGWVCPGCLGLSRLPGSVPAYATLLAGWERSRARAVSAAGPTSSPVPCPQPACPEHLPMPFAMATALPAAPTGPRLCTGHGCSQALISSVFNLPLHLHYSGPQHAPCSTGGAEEGLFELTPAPGTSPEPTVQFSKTKTLKFPLIYGKVSLTTFPM